MNINISERAIEKLIDFGGALLILLIGFAAIRIISHILKKLLAKSGHIDPSLHRFIVNTVRIALWIILLVSILGTLGVPIATFVAVLGAAGAAVALALKDSLSNFAGGILILINKPFSQGDYIQLGNDEGSVQHIDLLYTTLLTFDNKVVIAPNGVIANSTITNYSKEETRRVDCRFGISYDADINHAIDVMQAVTESNPAILQDPPPLIGVWEHGDSCVMMDLKVWTKTEEYWHVRYFLQAQVKLALDEAGISIPYPQMDVHFSK